MTFLAAGPRGTTADQRPRADLSAHLSPREQRGVFLSGGKLIAERRAPGARAPRSARQQLNLSSSETLAGRTISAAANLTFAT